MKFSFQQEIKDQLREEQAEWKPKTEFWQASDTGKCLRMRYYKRLAVPYLRPFDDRILRVFRAGDIFHWWLQRLAKNRGVLVAKECEVWNEDCSIIGHFDALIEPNGQDDLYLYEFKSKHSYGFKYLDQEGPQADHKGQVTLYKMLIEDNGYATMEKECDVIDGGSDDYVCINYPPIKIAGVRIMYVSKDDLRVMEFDGQTDESRVNGEYIKLIGYWTRKQLPPCTCKDQYNGKGAKYCIYGTSDTECCDEKLIKKEEK